MVGLPQARAWRLLLGSDMDGGPGRAEGDTGPESPPPTGAQRGTHFTGASQGPPHAKDGKWLVQGHRAVGRWGQDWNPGSGPTSQVSGTKARRLQAKEAARSPAAGRQRPRLPTSAADEELTSLRSHSTSRRV